MAIPSDPCPCNCMLFTLVGLIESTVSKCEPVHRERSSDRYATREVGRRLGSSVHYVIFARVKRYDFAGLFLAGSMHCGNQPIEPTEPYLSRFLRILNLLEHNVSRGGAGGCL
jgi:hypothetical protein